MAKSPADHPGEPHPPEAAAATLERLAARITELEQQVATLNTAVFPLQELKEEARQDSFPERTSPPSPPFPSPAIEQAVSPDHAGTPDHAEMLNVPGFPRRFPDAPKPSLESRLGTQVFNLVGVIALLFGAAWALKLAIEHGLVGPSARVLIGLAVGSGLILWSESFRRKAAAKPLTAFSNTLKAVGTSLLYLSIWAAFQLYALLSAPFALGAMLLVATWNAFMAFAQDAELLAGYALLGALLTPALLATGGDHETFLFTYLAAIVAAVVLLQRTKAWPRLLVPAFLASVAYFTGYYVRFFHASRINSWDSQSGKAAFFAVLFWVLFALVSTRYWDRVVNLERPGNYLELPRFAVIPTVLLPLANAAFLALALLSVLDDSGLHTSLAWLMLALAAVYLGLTRLQSTQLAAAVHLACAVVLLTIAIPLKASGQTLTTAWLIEGLVLFWIAKRVSSAAPNASLAGTSPPPPGIIATEASRAQRVLALLSLAGYILGLLSILFHWAWTFDFSSYAQTAFPNANLGSALVALGALAGAVWLAKSGKPEDLRIQFAALAAGVGVALLLSLGETAGALAATYQHTAYQHPAFTNPAFFTAVLALAVLAAIAWTARRLFLAGPERRTPLNLLAAVTLVLFNLTTILTIEREISALWTQPTLNRPDASLARSLALSGFLMLYGAALLAAGFWRRNAFVRWQALLLLLFTIAKVFVSDISGLSAGYRVTSFLALGVLLLTISFAYQKDWLSLKEPVARTGEHP